MPQITLLDAPSNLGLRPPSEHASPGVYKLPGALRDAGLLRRLGAADGGVVTAPRYSGVWDGQQTRNHDALVLYAETLAARIGRVLAHGEVPLVLGGDCSILIAAALAARRLRRQGLLFVDAHSDFRHPGDSSSVRSAAGEDLALVTGRGSRHLAKIGDFDQYVMDQDVVAVGLRSTDPYLDEMRAVGMKVITADDVGALGAEAAAEGTLAHFVGQGLEKFWLHLDADVVDPSVFAAVDTPAPGGLTLDQLGQLLSVVVASDRVLGIDVTILDPDLDPTAGQVEALADLLVSVLH